MRKKGDSEKNVRSIERPSQKVTFLQCMHASPSLEQKEKKT